MNFVHQINLAIVLTKFILCVHQNQATLRSNFSTTSKERKRILLKHLILLRRSQTTRQNLLLRDIRIVLTNLSLRSRRNNRRWELLVLLHTLRQLHATNFANPTLIGTPCTTTKIATNNHFHGEALAHHTHSNHRIGRSQLPVRTNICCSVQELSRNLVKHLTLKRNALRQNYIKGRNTVSSHHSQTVAKVIHIAHFTMINTLLSRKMEICFC